MTMITKTPAKPTKNGKAPKTLGPVSDLERHLPSEWWKDLFNSLYLKTDGDVVENHANTTSEIDLLLQNTSIQKKAEILDLCCGQGRHTLELARRGFTNLQGVDRSRYLIRLARKRATKENLKVKFSEGDARCVKLPQNSKDCVIIMGNSFGYFEKEEDDIKVLLSVKKILRPGGLLVLDIVDGEWMSKNFEPRSWEWIDKHHFVNRERSLASDGKRIISREVITNSEMGIIADQFYSERLYSLDEITQVLKHCGLEDISNVASIKGLSTRDQDLGMMANRLFITCKVPAQKVFIVNKEPIKEIVVIMGDPRLPDPVKKDGQFNSEDFHTIDQLQSALNENTQFKFHYLNDHANLLAKLVKSPPKFVFNLCDEGLFNKATFELHLPAILEYLNIPYSGAGPGTLALCYDKAKIRAIAASMDIPVPLETYFNPMDQSANIPSAFPAILKPCCGDSSIGITQKAVVHNARDLIQYIDFLREILPNTPVLVQEFLDGREFSVGILGNPPNLEVLPIIMVDYSSLPSHLPKILGYESKWDPKSEYWKDIRYIEADINEDLKTDLINYSKALFERTECRDYARFDFRCDAYGTPKLLEVNPNPGWCWDGKLNLMAKMSNISYPDLLNRILNHAIERISTK